MELLVEFELDQKSALQMIEQIKEAVEVELKRNSIKNYTVALIKSYDSDRFEVEVLHSQGYAKKETAP